MLKVFTKIYTAVLTVFTKLGLILKLNASRDISYLDQIGRISFSKTNVCS